MDAHSNVDPMLSRPVNDCVYAELLCFAAEKLHLTPNLPNQLIMNVLCS